MKTFIKITLSLIVTVGFIPLTANNRGNNIEYYCFTENVIPDSTISGGYIKVDTFNLNILPPSSGVQYYRDGIIYLSSSKAGSLMLPDHVSFGKTDVVYTVLNESGLDNPEIFSPAMNFSFPCDAITFSKDYKSMYFTKYSISEGVEKIYKAESSAGEGDQDKWTMDDNPVSFCSGNSIYTHPALSADGKIMIFSSNRTESLGGMDLYITQFEGGNWSEPKNLGDAINTRSNEMYPYLDQDNNLYYSSDGLLGYGGYDVYVCKFQRNTWNAPINVSTPVNTAFDDVAFKIDRKDGKSGFYTIKEKSGKRSVKLLKVTMTGSDAPDKMLTLSQFLTNPATRNVVLIVTEPAVEASDRRVVADRSRGKDDNIVYRVQIMTSFNPKTRTLINLEGKDYNIYEYLYSGAYRLCVGEFSTIAPATELRNKFIQNDYSQAIVVVFRNDVRSFDPELLEEPAVSATSQTTQNKAVVIPEKQIQPVAQVKEEVKKEVPPAVTKKPDPVKQPVKEPVIAKTEPAKTTLPVTTAKAAEPAKSVTQPASEKKDVVIYRVQILTNNSAKGSYKITINNKQYDTYEYNFAGAYRTCVGEFNTLAPAKELQNLVRKYGHPQAFVVAFKNNVRSTDPLLFK